MDFEFNPELVEYESEQTYNANLVLSEEEDTYNPVTFNVMPDEDGNIKIYKMTEDLAVRREKFQKMGDVEDGGGMMLDETVGFNEELLGELGGGEGEEAAADDFFYDVAAKRKVLPQVDKKKKTRKVRDVEQGNKEIVIKRKVGPKKKTKNHLLHNKALRLLRGQNVSLRRMNF